MTSTETGTSWSDRLSPRNWSLAWKLVAVGLVPAVLAIVLGVLRVADQARSASELETANQLLQVRNVVADAADALRVERDQAAVFVAERRAGDRGVLQDAVTRSDTALEQARVTLNGAEGVDPTSRAAQQEAEGGFAQLAVLRSEVGGTAPVTPAQVVGRYTAVIDRADVLGRALLRQMSTPEVAGLADALTAATGASEALARQHTVLGAALRLDQVTLDDRAAVNATDSALSNSYAFYLLAVSPTQSPVNFLNSPENARRDALKADILAAPDDATIPVTVAQWDEATRTSTEPIDAAVANVRTELTAAGAAAASRSSNLAGLNSVILMLGLLLAAAMIVLVTRSLTRSLRVLRGSALDVAQRRLPQAVESMRAGNAPDVTVEPVPVRSRDEVGQVARAFDAVHEQALRLAADQAALQGNVSSMFVNLSRRSQGLVERQLQLIEQLESNEQDPDQLSNLFQLDHLATRMRRNSENLLVLAGTDFAKRNVAPVPLVDVLRAAVSEIEHYQRITVQAPPQATIIGRATSDIVHLLAELLDNATNFSPPDSQVVMSSTRTGDGSIIVEIADLGVGMLENELADANKRLGTPTTVDVSASRRMGLFVVGRLGTRHGIAVHLGGAHRGGSGGGLTASVTLPAHLVVSSVDGGGRLGSGTTGTYTLPPVTPNGVPPQRAGRPERPLPRTALAAAENGQAGPQPTPLNGLPTRTPGSTLRREPSPTAGEGGDGAAAAFAPADAAVAVDPVTEGVPGTAAEHDRSPVRERIAEPSSGSPRATPWRPPDRPDGPGPTAVDTDGTDDVDGTRETPPTGMARTATGWAGPPARGEGSSPAATPADEAGTGGSGSSVGFGGVPPTEAAPLPVRRIGASRPAAPPAPSTSDGRDAPGSDAGAGAAGHGPAETEAVDEAAVRDRTAAGGPVDDAAADAADTDDDARTAGADPDARAHAGASVGDGPGRAPDGRTADGDVAAADAADPAAAESPAEIRTDDSSDARGEAEPEGESGPREPVATDAADDGKAAEERNAAEDRAADDDPAAPQPRPQVVPGPNGAHRGPGVPPTPYPVRDDDRNGSGQYGEQDEQDLVASPPTTPLPVVPVGAAPTGSAPVAAGPDRVADTLFSASVPAIAEPDGLPRSRRPLGELRRSDQADITETTPIFEEMRSAWFADDRPVPVDWELGQRPGAEPEQPAAFVPSALDVPRRPSTGEWLAPPAAPPAAPVEQSGSFATAADEGWRAASGVAAERPDELTSAGLPKRRPRARLVPGSAGSAVLAAPTSPTRSAESVRGRLASYQQGVRQGREVRLRHDPGGAGQPAPPENAASRGGERNEGNR